MFSKALCQSVVIVATRRLSLLSRNDVARSPFSGNRMQPSGPTLAIYHFGFWRSGSRASSFT